VDTSPTGGRSVYGSSVTLCPVASLRLVWQLMVSPYFFPLKTDIFFSHRPLKSNAVMPFLSSLPHSPPFNVVCLIFSINSAATKKIISFGCQSPPWMLSPGVVRPQWRYCLCRIGTGSHVGCVQVTGTQ